MRTCSECLCIYCLYLWSGRCRYGNCYDDYRAKSDPYTKHYPERHIWSNSCKPGEQEHWCRGGIFFPTEECESFEQYEGQKIEQCHKASTRVFQDGYRICPMMVDGSCDQCMREMDADITPKMTNADRIRSMTDDKLAEVISEWDNEMNKKEWLEWLRSEE